MAPSAKLSVSHKQTHRNRCRIPAARDQTFENRSLCTFAVQVEHLRIKFVCELDQLLFRHLAPVGFKPVTRFQIVEVMVLHLKNCDAAFMTDCPRLAIVKERLILETGSGR